MPGIYQIANDIYLGIYFKLIILGFWSLFLPKNKPRSMQAV